MSLKITAIATALLLVTVSQAQASPLESQLSKTTIGGMKAFKKGMSATIPAQASSILGGLTSINCPKGVAVQLHNN